VLVRLDLGGAPHRNRDDEEIGVPHLHLYREGFGDKWATPLPSDRFRNPADVWTTSKTFSGSAILPSRLMSSEGYSHDPGD
jgi:hypothetical protein